MLYVGFEAAYVYKIPMDISYLFCIGRQLGENIKCSYIIFPSIVITSSSLEEPSKSIFWTLLKALLFHFLIAHLHKITEER